VFKSKECASIDIGNQDPKFLKWAFGDDYLEQPMSGSPDMWNRLHIDLYESKESTEYNKDLNIMYDLYKEYLNKAKS
jgi:hypothetical protein